MPPADAQDHRPGSASRCTVARSLGRAGVDSSRRAVGSVPAVGIDSALRCMPSSTCPRSRPRRPRARAPAAAIPSGCWTGLNDAQRAAVTHFGTPLLIVAGRRLRQDPGADQPDRLPAGRPRGAPRRDHRDHLHQQGRRRDEGAGRRAGRRPGPADVGVHVPLGVRADPAGRARARRAQVDLLDLRRGRLAPADAAGRPRARPRPEALPGPRAGGRRSPT